MAVEIQRADPRRPDIAYMIEESDAYYARLYPAESNHLIAIESLLGASVHFFAARDALGALLGFGALALRDGFGEIKRMYVGTASRGGGVGAKLLQRLELTGKEVGLTLVRLETGIAQPEALSLYRKAGYTEIAAFGDYKPDPLSIFMEKSLVSGAKRSTPALV